jgi:hypothetical protein
MECDKINKLNRKKEKKPSLVFLGDKTTEAFHAFHESQIHVSLLFNHYTSDADCATKLKFPVNSISMFRSFDESPIQYKGALNFESLRRWMTI